MTANQLRQLLVDNFGIDKKWPESLIVDAETYANCCIDVFERTESSINSHNHDELKICVGKHNGIIFKNVELILKT